jgi:exonuclease VII large subunit
MTAHKPSNHSHTPPTHPPAHSEQQCTGCAAEYLAVLARQRALLGELDALSQRQSLLIDEPVLDPLLAVLEERQQVVDRITELHRTSEQLRQQWERMQEQLPESHRREVQRELDAVSALAEQVQRRDEQDHARLKKRLESVTAELASLSLSRQAATAYAPAPHNAPRFQDRHG